METALDHFVRRCRLSQSTVLVFYRGERSFFCKQWLRRWLAIPAIERRLELAGVAILFISSQSQGKAFSIAAQIATRRPALDKSIFFFGDPEHLLVTHLDAAGFARPVVTNPDSHRAHGWVFDYGMVQPAVIAVAADGSVLYEWVSKPSLLNVAGKLDRPDPFDVWDTIERRLDRVRIIRARAARAAAIRRREMTNADSDQAVMVTQPSVHSVGDVTHPPRMSSQDVREEKSDSELVAAGPRVPAERDVRRGKDESGIVEKMERAIQVGDAEVSQGLESDSIPAPLSTTIETLTTEPFSEQKSLSKEEPDLSDGDISSSPLQHFSSNINALATEVLAENTMPLEVAPHDQAIPVTKGQAIETMAEKLLTSADFIDEFEDIRDSKVDTDGEDEEVLGMDADEKEGSSTACAMGETEDSMSNECISAEFERLVVADDELVGSTHSTRGTSRMDSVTEPLTHARFSDCFDIDEQQRLQGHSEGMETSVPSMGSDQVDSSLLNNQLGSVRTEDSSNVNTEQFDERAFSFGRQILEEADDTKTGISDYLKELKEPEKRHYRVRGAGNKGMMYSRMVLNNATAAKADHRTDGDRAECVMEEAVLVSGHERKGSTTGTTESNEVFDEDKGREGESSKSMRGETDSPHPEVSGRGVVVDISPFADANHGLEKEMEVYTTRRGKLTDEYEAYDEYIVCEFEVEEYVEEYDSDTLSRSNVFVSGVVDEGSHDESGINGARVGGDGQRTMGTRRGEEMRKEVSVSGESVGKREERKEQAGDEMTEEEVRMGREGEGGGGGGMMAVRWMLRRMGVAKHGGGKEDEAERVGRKESVKMRSMEEEGERVGRKETFRGVLRRIPGAKWRREEEEQKHEGIGLVGRCGGLQAVLQRLPSLSGSARGQSSGEREKGNGVEVRGVLDGRGSGGDVDEGEEGEGLDRKRSGVFRGGTKARRFRLG